MAISQAGFWLIIIVLFVIVLFGVLSIIDKRGLKVRFGAKNWFPTFSIESARSEGVTREEMEAAVQAKVLEELGSHLFAMELYKDNCCQYDMNTKTLIAHKISDIEIPIFTELDLIQSQILVLTIKVELLVLNIENHYFQAAETEETLAVYLQKRFECFFRVFSKFSDDVKANRKSAFFVLKDWWGVVSPALFCMIKQRQDIHGYTERLFTEDVWVKRMGDVKKDLDNVAEVLSQHGDVTVIIRNYFIANSYDVPTYLE
ncbi:MAG: hypothetical protein GXY86_04945 [Firmicutes bacterium]|nr:hypothetical protein [Bacillota bacterium]